MGAVGRASRAAVGVVLAAAFAPAVAGCGDLTIANVAPTIPWAAVEASPDAEGAVRATVWLVDPEGDPVDLAATWEPVNGAAVSLEVAPSGDGVVGLSTYAGRFDPHGQPRAVHWLAGDALTADSIVRLVLTPTDWSGDEGPTVATPAFRLGDGLPEATATEPR